MAFRKKMNRLIISVGIIAVWVIFNFLLFYPARDGLGPTFGIAAMYIFTRNFALYGGLIILLLRVVRIIRSNSNLPYIFMGILNLMIGVLCIVLFYLSYSNLPWLNKCLLNLLIGFIMWADTFIVFRTTKGC